MKKRYASVVLKRLMFLYFLQRNGFLCGDPDYLTRKLDAGRKKGTGRFFRRVLSPLFFPGDAHGGSGFSRPPGGLSSLPDGIFIRQPAEELYGGKINLPDEAFRRLFAFFGEYRWRLGDSPPDGGERVVPDALGDPLAQGVERKRTGSYYTEADVTEYIAVNTIVPVLFDTVRGKVPAALDRDAPAWKLLQSDPDRYIYPAVRKGMEFPLPAEIAYGIEDVSKRGAWDPPAPEAFALPTETWREVVARRLRCGGLRKRLAAGEISAVDDLVTANLDVRRFARDAIAGAEDPGSLRAYWDAVRGIAVLDPSAGSGAFLAAAMDVLEPLYLVCLERMRVFAEEPGAPDEAALFRKILAEAGRFSNPLCFARASIIRGNLFGVDTSEEAAESCRMRLFLDLAAAAETPDRPKALPKMDFNIRVGNALVGFTGPEDVRQAARGGSTAAGNPVSRKTRAVLPGVRARRRGRRAPVALDELLARRYGLGSHPESGFSTWRNSHKPFHWHVEFPEVFRRGGFDAVVGNPPYVEYRESGGEYSVRGYRTQACGNLYAYFLERSLAVADGMGRVGLIVQLPAVCTDRMAPLQAECLGRSSSAWFATFDDRPGRLFAGLEHARAAIVLLRKGRSGWPAVFATRYNRWYSEARRGLFAGLSFADVSPLLQRGIIPKAGSPLAESILKKISAHPALGNSLGGGVPVYYHNAPQYWIRAADFAPFFWNQVRGRAVSAQVKPVRLRSRADALCVAAVLNSSLFYWWFLLRSDCRHLNPREILSFPFGLRGVDPRIKNELGSLVVELAADLKKHARRKGATYRATGKVRFDEFHPKCSKPILDRIDRVLAGYYGLTGEELDFITHYDIKFRMGWKAGER